MVCDTIKMEVGFNEVTSMWLESTDTVEFSKCLKLYRNEPSVTGRHSSISRASPAPSLVSSPVETSSVVSDGSAGASVHSINVDSSPSQLSAFSSSLTEDD